MMARVKDPVGGHKTNALWLIAAAEFSATDKGDPIALTFTWDSATISSWSPCGRNIPATIATVALFLSFVARDRHQEDNDNPAPARCWQMTLEASSMMKEHPALISKTVLGMGDEGGIASGFKPQLEFVAFWSGIG